MEPVGFQWSPVDRDRFGDPGRPGEFDGRSSLCERTGTSGHQRDFQLPGRLEHLPGPVEAVAEVLVVEDGDRATAVADHAGDLVGQVFAMFVLTVAAAEATIGLSILVVYFRNQGTVAVEDINLMRG